MMNLAEYRNRNTRLADFLPWVALVGEGIVLNKDGSLQRTARFRGPDLDSAVPAELVAVAGRLNNAFRRLGSGWAIFVEAQRHGAATYPASVFADSASALVDAERKADFEEAGAHFESSYFLTFLYLFWKRALITWICILIQLGRVDAVGVGETVDLLLEDTSEGMDMR